jgi:hypothetical protein
MRRVLAVSALLIAVAACSDTEDEPTPSASCLNAMRATQDAPFAEVDPAMEKTLMECSTAAEWLVALRRYPGAMGLTTQATIGSLDIQAACRWFGDAGSQTPVCRDAEDSGLLDR